MSSFSIADTARKLWGWLHPGSNMSESEIDELASWFDDALVDSKNVVFDDYIVSGTALARPAAGAPTLTNFRGNVDLYAFGGASGTEEAFFTVHILHGIKPGTTPTFHVHWSQNAASPSGNVKWQVEYSIAKGYGAGTFGAPVTLSSVQAVTSQYEHQITDDDDMPLSSITELEPDAIIIGRIFRNADDAEDTSTDDAFLIQIDMHYERDKIGTTERNRPFTGF